MKYVCVKEAPSKLRPGEYVVHTADFIPQIKDSMRRAGRGNTLQNNHLRSIIQLIISAYNVEDKSEFNVRINRHEGLEYSSVEDISKIVCNMLRIEYPEIFDIHLAKSIQERPMGTKVIYFVGDFTDSRAFTVAGFEHIVPKEIDYALGLKTKKVVGKPAVKDAK